MCRLGKICPNKGTGPWQIFRYYESTSLLLLSMEDCEFGASCLNCHMCIHWSWQFCLVSTVMSHYAKAVTDHSSRMTFNILSIIRLYLLNFNFTTNTDSNNIIMSVRNDVWVKSMMALTDEMKTSQTFQHKSAIQPTKHYLSETKIRVQREIKRKWAKQDGDVEMMKKRWRQGQIVSNAIKI